jgi:hypothetical protein
VRDKVSHPYKTTGKIIVLYILIFTFLYKSINTVNKSILRQINLFVSFVSTVNESIP